MTADSSQSPEDESDEDDAFVEALANFDEQLRRGTPLLGSQSSEVTFDQGVDGAQACLRLLDRAFPRANNVPEVQENDRLGRFELLRFLGQGGFGVVYLARDPRLERLVALKIPRLHTVGNATLHERFLREARAAAALDHPNILPILETGEIGPICYIASAYCDGADLAQWIKTHAPVAPTLAAKILRTLSDATHFSHTRGILHRDLKPSNVLLAARNSTVGAPDDELPFVLRLTDFGLARIAEEGLCETGSMVLGTPTYMAPEQALGHNDSVGVATDVYALGVILYELLAARPPFQGTGLVEVFDQIRLAEPIPPSQLVASIPRGLETICLKCLRKEPKQRYATAAELRDDLQRFLDHKPILAQPVSAWERAVKWGRRHPARLSAIFILLVSALLMIGGLIAHLREMDKQLLVSNQLRTAGLERELRLRLQAYVGEVEVASSEMAAGLPQLALRRLERLVPAAREQTDVRGPEWQYLARQARPTKPVSTLRNNPNGLRCIGVTRDGRLAASRDFESVRVWEVKSGIECASFPASSTDVETLRFSADGNYLACNTRAEGIRIWNTFDWTVASQIGRDLAVTCLDFSPDGERIISGGKDGEVRCWDWRNAKEHWHKRLDSQISQVRYSHGGKAAYTCSTDGKLTRWDTVNGKLFHSHTIGNAGEQLRDIDLPPDSRFVIGGGPGRIVCYDTRELQQWVILVEETIGAVACSQDGLRAALGTDNGQIYLLTFGPESFRGVRIQQWTAHDVGVSALTFVPTGNQLISSSLESTEVWNLADVSTERVTFLSETRVNYVGFSHTIAGSKDRISAVGSFGGSGWMRMWNIPQLKDEGTSEIPGLALKNVAASSIGDILTACAEHEAFVIWDKPNVQSAPHRVDVRGIRTIALAPDNKTLAVAINLENTPTSVVDLYDVGTRALLRRLCSTDAQIVGLAYAQGGRALVATFRQSPVLIINTTTGKSTVVPGSGLEFKPANRIGGADQIAILAALLSVDPSGAVAASGYWCPLYDQISKRRNGNEVQLIDVESAAVKSTFRHGSATSQTTGLAISPDGRIVAIASYDTTHKVGQVQLWHIETGRNMMELPCFQFVPHDLCFLPGGKYLAAPVVDLSSRTNDGILLWPLGFDSQSVGTTLPATTSGSPSPVQLPAGDSTHESRRILDN